MKMAYENVRRRKLWLFHADHDDDEEVQEEDPGIYNSLRPTILLANLFGLSPLSNALKPRTKDVGFQWISISTVYSLFVFGWLTWSAGVAVLNLALTPVSTLSFGTMAALLHNPIFYTSAAMSSVLTFNLTRKLPRILNRWDEAVGRLPKYLQMTEPERPSCVMDRLRQLFGDWSTVNNRSCRMSAKRSTWISFVFISSAVVEHCLHDAMEFNRRRCRLRECPQRNFIFCCLSPMNSFVEHSVGPNSLLVLASYITQKFATFSWNYHDLLLIQLSSALTVNLKVLADYVKRVTAANRRLLVGVDWKTLREDHGAMCEVVRDIDDAVSPIVLFSYAVNIYFVAIQIFIGVHLENRSWVEICYIVTSFGHIIGRMISVTQSASNLYDQTYGPLVPLLYVPAQVYNGEVKRFIDHLTCSTIGFTGWKMFVVNRRLFLAIISLIITYELLLLDVQ